MTGPLRIVVAEFMDEAAVAMLEAKAHVVNAPDVVDDPARLPGLLGDAHALIVRNRTQVTADVLDAGPRLEVVGRLGVGLDNIDQAACAERGIGVIPATGANTASVVEYVITNALSLLRRTYDSFDEMIAGEWPRQAAGAGRELRGKTLGLVGFGEIARATAAAAQALGMHTAAHDPFVAADDPAWNATTNLGLEALLAASDVVSLHVPLTAETHHLIDGVALATMKPDAVLINAARGGVVDEEALADALGTGQIGGAALDVFETEPLTADAAMRFRGLSNVVLTPHIAGVTVESNERVSAMIAERVLAALGAPH